MAPREVAFDDLPSWAGEELGTSEWHDITQEDVNAFADVTRDRQWIHIDRERAEKESPYGTTIAHGYFTLSLIPYLGAQIWKATGSKMGVNYGLNKLRFPAPVKVGTRVRAHSKLSKVDEVEGGYQLVVTVTIEAEGSEKPVAVAETVSRIYN